MKVTEFRMVMPFTVEEYHRAQLYMVSRKTRAENEKFAEQGTPGEGLEVLVNEPFDDGDWQGQYTMKHYHLISVFPKWAQVMLPKNSLIVVEHSWNAYPYCKTTWSCPLFEKFSFTCESMHLPDRGETENALRVEDDILQKRTVDRIDLVGDPFPAKKYSEETDPACFQSKKYPDRGQYDENWMSTCEPHCCAYKLVTAEFGYWGLQGKTEALMMKMGMRDVIQEAHRELITWLDEWVDLTMKDIRDMEDNEMEVARKTFGDKVIDEKQAQKMEEAKKNPPPARNFGFSRVTHEDLKAIESQIQERDGVKTVQKEELGKAKDDSEEN